MPADVQTAVAGTAARQPTTLDDRRFGQRDPAPAGSALRHSDWTSSVRPATPGGRRAPLDPQRAYATAWEEEPDGSAALVPTAVVFLTNRECPFRCVMCDLWRNTLDETVPRGAIAAPDPRRARRTLPPARQIKLYNAGSFFDPQRHSPDDDAEIAPGGRRFERVIVESHPAFLAGVYARAVPAVSAT